MLRVAAMGDTESVKGFAAVGLDVYPCDTPAEAPALFHRLTAGEYGVIFLTEELTEVLSREVAALDGASLPAVIPIPGVKNNTGVGLRRLSEAVEKAVGADILFS